MAINFRETKFYARIFSIPIQYIYSGCPSESTTAECRRIGGGRASSEWRPRRGGLHPSGRTSAARASRARARAKLGDGGGPGPVAGGSRKGWHAPGRAAGAVAGGGDPVGGRRVGRARAGRPGGAQCYFSSATGWTGGGCCGGAISVPAPYRDRRQKFTGPAKMGAACWITVLQAGSYFLRLRSKLGPSLILPIIYISYLAMLKTAAETYNRRFYSKFEEQFSFTCQLLESERPIRTYKVIPSRFQDEATIVFNSEVLTITCSCRKYECIGMYHISN
jgi:hypothetical protein